MKILHAILGTVKWMFLVFSGIVFILFILSFTSAPFWAFYSLGTSKAELRRPPDFLVLLGGSGMPAGSNLVRLYYTEKLAQEYPVSRIIIALPGDTANPGSSLMLMRGELIRAGIDSARIFLEPEGLNTRSQALNVFALPVSRGGKGYFVLVTSPEHMRRAWLSFRKAGFLNLGGVPAFDNPNESELRFEDRKLGGRKQFVPEIGNNLGVRYNFWTQLNYELLVFREYSALAFYRLKGWI